jgi:hypothetical protein
VKFSVDAIDDTDIIEDILIPRVESIGGQIKKVILSGTHLTPCIQVWLVILFILNCMVGHMQTFRTRYIPAGYFVRVLTTNSIHLVLSVEIKQLYVVKLGI